MAGLREASARANRARLDNVLYVRAGVESLPVELRGVADRVTIVLPWGSLLAAVGIPAVPLLRGIRALCRPEASLTVLIGVDPVRDRGEMVRLGLPRLSELDPQGRRAEAYAAAGFELAAVRSIGGEELAGWPSNWARRLAYGRPRTVFHVEARARLDPPPGGG